MVLSVKNRGGFSCTLGKNGCINDSVYQYRETSRYEENMRVGCFYAMPGQELIYSVCLRCSRPWTRAFLKRSLRRS